VVWLAEVGADRHKVLHAAPLSVGGLLRERLFGRSTVVLTSATLALGGNFDALARQWGLPPSERSAGGASSNAERSAGGASSNAERSAGSASTRTAPGACDDPVPDPDAPKWSGLDVGSPFAHARSGILYVAKSLPPPGRDGLPPAYLDEIAGLVEAAGGRTLGLFSSMRAAKQATEALRERLATPLLCQGDDATMLLVKRFAEDEETSLFGTLSLWQGVDVPGPSLSCVIIDRIPFPRPDDPLVTARQRAADSRGGNGFLQVSATHAALLLAQGAGRLLRGMEDRGVVAVLDPRLATARYGGFLRASLPPFWPTDDPATVRAALRRLRGA
jgi:ATP-dependent DNA helicase DinG